MGAIGSSLACFSHAKAQTDAGETLSETRAVTPTAPPADCNPEAEHVATQAQLQLQLQEVKAIADSLALSVQHLSTLPVQLQCANAQKQQPDPPDLPGSLSSPRIELQKRSREHTLTNSNSGKYKEALLTEVEDLSARVKALEGQLAEIGQMKEDWEAHRAAQEFSRQIKKLEEVGIPMHFGGGGGPSNLARISAPNSRSSSCAMSFAEEMPSLEGLPFGKYPKPQAYPLPGPLGGGPCTPIRRPSRNPSLASKAGAHAWGPERGGAPPAQQKTPGKHKQNTSGGASLGRKVQPHGPHTEGRTPSPMLQPQQSLPQPPTAPLLHQHPHQPHRQRRQQQHHHYQQHQQRQQQALKQQQQQQQQQHLLVKGGAIPPTSVPAPPSATAPSLLVQLSSVKSVSEGSDGMGAGRGLVERDDEGSSEHGEASTSMLVQPPAAVARQQQQQHNLQGRGEEGSVKEEEEKEAKAVEEEEDEEPGGSVAEGGGNSHGSSLVGSLGRLGGQGVPWASRNCKSPALA